MILDLSLVQLILRRLHTSRGPAQEVTIMEGARPKLIKYGLEDYVVDDGSKKDDGGAQGQRLKHSRMRNLSDAKAAM